MFEVLGTLLENKKHLKNEESELFFVFAVIDLVWSDSWNICLLHLSISKPQVYINYWIGSSFKMRKCENIIEIISISHERQVIIGMKKYMYRAPLVL